MILLNMHALGLTKIDTVYSEIFANSVKTHICDIKKSLQGHNFPISENDREISPNREDLFSRNFSYAKFRENTTIVKISEFTVYFDISVSVQYCSYKSYSKIDKNMGILGKLSTCRKTIGISN